MSEYQEKITNEDAEMILAHEPSKGGVPSNNEFTMLYGIASQLASDLLMARKERDELRDSADKAEAEIREAYKEGYEKGSSEHGAIYISRKIEEEAERACRDAASKALQGAADRLCIECGVSNSMDNCEHFKTCWIRAAIISGGEKL